MINLAKDNYSHDDIKKALIGNRVIGFRCELLNKNENTIGNVTASGRISNDIDTTIVRCADLTIKEIKDINIIDERIKPYFRIEIGGNTLEYPLGVFLISSPDNQYDGYGNTRSCQCYDKTVILKEDKFDSRYFIAAGSSYTTAVMQILGSAGFSNYTIVSSAYTLTTDIEFEIGTSKIDAINSLLDAINYNHLHFDANGIPCTEPFVEYPERTIDDTYATNDKSIIKPAIKRTLDIFDYPNKIVRYVENPENSQSLKSIYINSNPASLLSTTSRGRTIVDIESVTDIADQATLDAYVRRLAYQKQVQEIAKFPTAIMPHHDYADCLGLDIPECGISGKYIEYAWEIDLEVGGSMTHYCRKVVQI